MRVRSKLLTIIFYYPTSGRVVFSHIASHQKEALIQSNVLLSSYNKSVVGIKRTLLLLKKFCDALDVLVAILFSYTNRTL